MSTDTEEPKSEVAKVLPFRRRGRTGWEEELDLSQNGGVKATGGNLGLVLEKHPEWKDVLAYDEFRDRPVLVGPPPYASDWAEPCPMRDTDFTAINVWMGQNGYTEFPKNTVYDVVQRHIERQPKYHPVRQYLHKLAWDKTPRIDRFLATYFGAEENEYTRLVGRYWLISAVSRVMNPGCQVDHMMILEGEQGIRKSTALRELVGEEWFLSTLMDIANKDIYTLLAGKWVVEFAELDGMRRADHNRLKAFLTEREGSYVPKYARMREDHARQCVFAGTVNDSSYLHDETGARRFWPVRCKFANAPQIAKDRDQIWAEAFHIYMGHLACVMTNQKYHGVTGEYAEDLCMHDARCKDHRWWPDGVDLPLFTVEQVERYDYDAWEDHISKFMDTYDGDKITIAEVLQRCFELDPKDHDRIAQIRVSKAMSKMGWRKGKHRWPGGGVKNGFARPVKPELAGPEPVKYLQSYGAPARTELPAAETTKSAGYGNGYTPEPAED